MPLFHCEDCHHEWESASNMASCDWCGGKGTILEQKTPLEKMLDEMVGDPNIVNLKRKNKKKTKK